MNNISLKSGTIYLTFSSFIFVLSAYIINIFLGRVLGPVGYGDYGIIISLMSIFNIIQTSGLPQTVSKFVAEDEEKSDQIMRKGIILQLISTGIISVLFFTCSYPIAVILHDKSLIPYIQLSALIFPGYGIYALYIGYYNGLHIFKKQAVLSSVYALLKAISIICLTYFFHIYGAIIGFIISPILSFLSNLDLPKKSTASFSYKKLILFSLPLIGFALLLSLQQSIDLLFVKSLARSPVAPGYYTANQNISQIIFYGLSAFSLVLYPSISRSMSKKNIQQTKEIIQNSLRYVLLILIPGALLISATSKPLLQLIYSDKYTQGAQSLSILIIGISFLTFSTVLGNILNAAGHPKKTVLVFIAGVITSAIFCIILIPLWGLNGAAIATTIGSVVITSIISILVFRIFHQLVSVSSLIKIFCASIVIYVIATLFPVKTILLPVWYGGLFVIYSLLLIIFKEVSQDDWEHVKALIPKNLRRV